MSHVRFIHCAHKLYCEPWAILPAKLATIADVFERHLRGEVVDFEAAQDDADPTEYDVIDGVAVVPVRGVISKDISHMERMSGAVDVEDIGDMMESAAGRADVDAILLRVNSPGGTVTGVPDLAERIAEINQDVPVLAYADGLMASAAYYLAAGADAIYAGQSAEVGSIGVYIAMLDQTEAYRQAGFRRDIIKSSETPHKAAGYPGTALTPDQREQMQAQVDFLYSEFASFIRDHRNPADYALRGQTFIGPQAVGAGLVDSVATMSEALRDARARAASRKS